ncbi:hypothetical protein L1987_02274 [Smallanthus sonchifolius]|uniref:Uncharacterized protein n=1 Tax=Smallanthus sonchifolius TaxID=185202 RepID=A0ACB9K7F1_9ASTR|nr:hypothetical protein L1987_02274 [Smallanthus sonchifolius]
MVSKGKSIKKKMSQPTLEARKSDTPKPESSIPRSKSFVSKKRKSSNATDVASLENLSYVDVHKKLHVFGHLALEQMTRCYELVVKEAEDAKQKESYEQAKTPAAISIFQARIKMAKEADDKDFDRAKWDVQEWKRPVAKLGGEPVQEASVGSLVVEDEAEGSVKVTAEVVEQDNEGDKEKA